MKILCDLKTDKAAEIDNISGKFLKDGAIILAEPISQICNLSIKFSTFLLACKTDKLKLLFKKGSKTDPKNYRQFPLLPIFSNAPNRLNCLKCSQSGFRKDYSTNSCLSYLCDKILKGFDSGVFTGMILIDQQKLFDTLNHDIIIK